MKFLLHKLRFLAVVMPLWGVATAVFAESKIKAKERPLPKGLAEAFCGGDFSFRTLWSHNVYDAQVEGVVIRSSDKSKVPLAVARERAKELAKNIGNHGYASGVCGDGSAWAATLPSDVSLDIKGGILKLNLRPQCHGDIGVFWVDSGVGVAQKISVNVNGSRYVLPTNKDGFVSVVCSHKQRGPVELFLAPVGKPKLELPESTTLVGNDTKQKVLAWVNAIRRREKIPEVKFSEELSRSAESLATDKAIAHNMAKLQSESLRLKNKGFVMLGEDRSRAGSLEEVLTLLWISPLHRDLLLNKEATVLGLAVQEGPEFSINLVFAHELNSK